MKVLYDLQAFQWTRYSGIPRYFAELIREFKKSGIIDISLPSCYCINKSYQSLFPNQNASVSWLLREKIFEISTNYLHKNPVRMLSSPINDGINYINKNDYDIFHPTFFNPYFLSHLHGKPYVLTIHDLSLELYPELGALSNRTPSETKQVIQGASHFIADSKFTKKHFVEYYDVDSDLVDVVYLGPTFEKVVCESSHDFSVSEKPYLLYVNLRSGRKNFYAMLSIIKDILIQENLNLVCGGGGSFTAEELEFFRLQGIADRVKYVNADDAKLKELYQNALAFIFPSIYEGFGIPILEAFACGCPVILSNASCLPEVGGDAAVYFDPKEPTSMKDAVWKVISDEKLREKMRDAGYEQLAKFSWEKCADETKAVYEKAI